MDDNEQLVNTIIDATYGGDIDSVRRVLKQHPLLVRHAKGGVTFLHDAASQSNPAMIDLLIDLGCEVDAEEEGSGKETPLDCAVMHDNPVIVEKLLKHGGNPNHGRKVIGAMVGPKKYSLEMVKLLDQYGADLHKVFVNEYTNEPMNALSTALDWGKEDVAKYLRSRGCVLPPRTAPQEEAVLAEVVADLEDEVLGYFREHFGPVQKLSLIEIVPSGIPVAVHFIPPSAERNHLTLFTTGLASHPMSTPEGMEQYARAELFIQLPADWKYQDYSDPNCGWPHYWLRSMAQYPSQQDTWLGGAVTVIDNEDPPRPLAPNTRFNSLLLMAERDFVSREGDTIQLYRMTPLYPEERDLKRREGIGPLLLAFDCKSIPFIVDLQRPNAAK